MRNRLLLAVAASAALGAAMNSAAKAELIYGMTTVDGATGSTLVSYDSATPAVSTLVGALTGGVNLRACDFRPSNGILYAVGYTTTGNLARVYTVSTSTGLCTPVGPAIAVAALGTSTRLSVDFNPVTDELRVVSGGGGNVRMNANTGALIAADTAIPAAALIAGVAYNNNFVGAGSTTLYGYNYITDEIDSINGATGALTVIGSTGGPSAFSADCGMDISGATGIAYLNMDDSPSSTGNDEMYTVNLTTGALSIITTPLLDNEMAVNLLDMSVAPVPEPTTLGLAAIGLAGLARRRRA